MMVFNIFSSTLHTKLGFPHPTARGFFQCICNQAIDSTRIHLFCCAHGGEHMATHDVIQDSFTSIAKDVMLHVLCEQTHVLSMSFLQSS